MFHKAGFNICLILLVSTTFGCASSNNKTNSQEKQLPEKAPLDGLWIGKFDIEGRGPYDFTVLQIDGTAYAISLQAKTMCVGTAQLEGENFISKYILFALDGGPIDRATITGKLDEENQITSHYVTLKGGETGALNLAYSSVYDMPSSFEITQGSWSFTDSDGLTTELLIANNGTVSGHDSVGCEYLGYLDIINPTYNAYKIKVEISQCGSVEGEYEGVSYVANDQLNVHITNENYGLFYTFDNAPIAE